MGQENNIQLWSSHVMGVSSASFKVSGGEIHEPPELYRYVLGCMQCLFQEDCFTEPNFVRLF